MKVNKTYIYVTILVGVLITALLAEYTLDSENLSWNEFFSTANIALSILIGLMVVVEIFIAWRNLFRG